MSTDLYTNSFSDKGFFVKSRKLAAPADATYNIIRVPKNAFVDAVWIKITTAYTAAGATLDVGWLGNTETAVTNGFFTSDVSDPTVTGLKRAQKDTLTTFEGKYFYLASGAITVTTDDNGGTAGTLWVFCHYWVIQ